MLTYFQYKFFAFFQKQQYIVYYSSLVPDLQRSMNDHFVNLLKQ